jgi:signal transduction histidine kinase
VSGRDRAGVDESPPGATSLLALISLKKRTLFVFATLIGAFGVGWLVFAAVRTSAASLGPTLLASLLAITGMLVGSLILASLIGEARRELDRQTREIGALREAMPTVFGELSLEATLQRVVDQARILLQADFGALSVVDDEGAIRQFIVAGIGDEEKRRIGEPPRGRGLLGVPLFEGQALRVDDLEADARSTGLPPHHPPVATLLAVPVPSRVCRANLYLANRSTGNVFSEAAGRTLKRFGHLAAIAIEMSHLHEELSSLAVEQERLRIAREMHDGMAQVLAYVNTKAQAVQQHVRRGRLQEADANLTQLAEAAREVYSEVRESILGLRTLAETPEEFSATVEDYLRKWEVQTGISVHADLAAELAVGGRVSLEVLRILQESLANVRKHAGASEVRVALSCLDGELTLAVRDNGCGFDLLSNKRNLSGRYGLVTMRERAQGVDGALTIESKPGTGTLVKAEIPLGLLGQDGST